RHDREDGSRDTVSRRKLLGKAAAVAAGGIGLALGAAAPASADSGDNLGIGHLGNGSGTDGAQLASGTRGTAFEVYDSSTGDAVFGLAVSGKGVYGSSDTGYGAVGQSNSGDGVRGYLLGANATGSAVHGICQGTGGKGVFGECTNTDNGGAAV